MHAIWESFLLGFQESSCTGTGSLHIYLSFPSPLTCFFTVKFQEIQITSVNSIAKRRFHYRDHQRTLILRFLILPRKLTVGTTKMDPWKRRFRTWKPSFSGSMLVFGGVSQVLGSLGGGCFFAMTSTLYGISIGHDGRYHGKS